MSNITTDPSMRSNETTNEGLIHEPPIVVDSSLDAGIASDDTEEGEIREDFPIQDDNQRVQEGQTQNNHSVGEKRKRSSSTADQLPQSISRPYSFDKVPSYANIGPPTSKLSCFVSVDGGEAFGSLYPEINGLMVQIYIDPGCYGDPTVCLSLRHSWTVGHDNARQTWDMNSYTEGQYSMDNVRHGYAHTNGSDPRASNPKVISRCNMKDEGNLVYLKFDSWVQRKGYSEASTWAAQSDSVKESLTTMFLPTNSYTVEVWFIAPFDARSFRERCLNVFSEMMDKRVHHFSQCKDEEGNFFNDRAIWTRGNPTNSIRRRDRLVVPAKQFQKKQH